MSPAIRHKPGLAPGTGDCLKCKARRNRWILCYIAAMVTVTPFAPTIGPLIVIAVVVLIHAAAWIKDRCCGER